MISAEIFGNVEVGTYYKPKHNKSELDEKCVKSVHTHTHRYIYIYIICSIICRTPLSLSPSPSLSLSVRTYNLHAPLQALPFTAFFPECQGHGQARVKEAKKAKEERTEKAKVVPRLCERAEARARARACARVCGSNWRRGCRSRSMENVRKVVENMGNNSEQQDPIYKWFDSTLEDLQGCSLSPGTHQSKIVRTIPTRT